MLADYEVTGRWGTDSRFSRFAARPGSMSPAQVRVLHVERCARSASRARVPCDWCRCQCAALMASPRVVDLMALALTGSFDGL